MIKTVGDSKNIIQNWDYKNWAIDTGQLKSGEMPLSSGGVSSTSFMDFLTNAMQEVNQYQSQANEAIAKLATGKVDNIHETMVMVEKADLAFRTMNQIRTKIIDAYREVMKMQI